MNVKAEKAVFAILAVIFAAAVILLAVILKVPTSFLYDNKQLVYEKTETETGDEKPRFEKKATFVIAGDAMFDRLIYHRFKNQGLENIFKKFDPKVFAGADLSLVNLEGPISSEPITDDVSPDNLSFNFPPATVPALKYAGISAVSLANNHTSNAGTSGFETTKKILDQNSIKHAGSPSAISDRSVLKIDGDIQISIIAVNILSVEASLESYIKNEKDTGQFVVVFPHWGNEYQKVHSATQEHLAKSWIDWGADMIVGSHPHVVQDFEIYKDRPIVYSLGNFIFDQTFSRDTQQGLLLAGVIREKSLELTFLPIKQVNLMPELTQGTEKSAVIDKILSGASGFERTRTDTIKMDR